MIRAFAFLSTLPLLFQGAPALAWGDLGHETVAHIAQMRMTPKASAWVESILGPEPLAIAAIWPDQVRDDARYDAFKSYHLCDVANGPGGTQVLAADPHNCLSIFKTAPVIISDPKIPKLQKMIALRYLIHVVGDVHQPLHVGNGFDLGGNLCNIRIPNPQIPREAVCNGTPVALTATKFMNLHSYWDSNVVDGLSSRLRGGNKGWFGSKQLATAILAKRLPMTPPAALGAIFNSMPEQWIAESAQLRRKAYPDSAFPGFDSNDDRTRPYCRFLQKDEKGVGVMHAENYKDAAIPTLTPEMEIGYQDLAEEQIFKAGLRLAAILNTWAASVSPGSDANAMSDLYKVMAIPARPLTLPAVAPR